MLSRGEYERAIELFTELLKDNPEDAHALYHRGVAFLEKGFPDTAIEDFTRVVRRRSRNPLAYTRRAQAYLLIERPLKAISDCTEAIRLQPQNAVAYQWRGMAYLERSNYERAAADLGEATELQPDLVAKISTKLAETYYMWSLRKRSKGHTNEAEVLLKRAKEHDAAYVASRIDAATGSEAAPLAISVDTLASRVAKQSYNQQRSDTSNAERFYREGLCYLGHGRSDDAIDRFTEALKADPTLINAYIYRGYAYLKSGLPYTAVRDFNEALPPSESRPVARAYLGRAHAFLELENFFRARVDATEAIRLVPSSGKAFHIRGFAYLKEGKLDQAIADLERSLRLVPVATSNLTRTLACAYHERGKIHREQRREVEAAADFARAKELMRRSKTPDSVTHAGTR